MQNYTNVFEKYYSETPFKKIVWNQLDEDEIFDTLNRLEVPQNFRIVSLGCGTGQKEIFAAKKGYKNIVGVDISQSAIKKAQSLSRKARAHIRFYVGDIISLNKFIVFKELKEPDLLLDWMSFHTVTKEHRKKYIEIVNAINPRWFLIRTFSKRDSDYKKSGKNKLPNMGVEQIYRHFFRHRELVALFDKFYSVIKFDTKECVNPERFIDNKAAAKITVLFFNKKKIFS